MNTITKERLQVLRHHPELITRDEVLTLLWREVYPEKLPCRVSLGANLHFGIGVSTSMVLAALQRRAEIYTQQAAMSPAERAKEESRLERLRGMLPVINPASALYELILTTEEVLRISDRDHDAWDRAREAVANGRRVIFPENNKALSEFTGLDE